MRSDNILNIVRDLIVENIFGRKSDYLHARDWVRHLRHARPESRNDYGFPILRRERGNARM